MPTAVGQRHERPQDVQKSVDLAYETVMRSLADLFENGDERFPVTPLAKDDARRAAAGVMLVIMCSGGTVQWDHSKRLTVEVPLRQDMNAKVEFSGPVYRTDIQRLKKHLDLVAESLPES